MHIMGDLCPTVLKFRKNLSQRVPVKRGTLKTDRLKCRNVARLTGERQRGLCPGRIPGDAARCQGRPEYLFLGVGNDPFSGGVKG